MLLLVLLTIFSSFLLNISASVPVIGILSQETHSIKQLFTNEENKIIQSYIAASYVKFTELSAAQVVPVWIGQNESYYKNIVNYTNGLLFPGGGTYFTESNGYGEAAKQLYELAMKINDAGIYYPILGICLGMEVLAYAATNGTDIRTDCDAKNIALPLDIIKEYKSTKLFTHASDEVINILKKENVTYNYHMFCLEEKSFKNYSLLDDWRIVSRNKDVNNIEFISTIENKKYPFYGLQFHPEKNLFEFTKPEIPHTRNAVIISQYFANFFIEETLKNNNKFPSDEQKNNALIYNYAPKYTGNKNGSFEQIYVFDVDDVCRGQLI